MKILVVDDEQDVQDMLKNFFEMFGHEAKTAKDIKTATTQIEEFKPEIIFLDLKLGEEDGLEVLQYSKQNHKDTKVVVVTGMTDTETKEKTLKLGADGYATKPIIPSELNKLIKDLSK
jgi:DNA-binding response OmpR family regulator